MYDVDIVSLDDEKKLHVGIRKALVCGSFMQVAHREGPNNKYVTVKDGQITMLHPSCGLERAPEWVVFNEIILTTNSYIHTVTEVEPEWLVQYAPNYFDLSTFQNGETKRALQRAIQRRTVKFSGISTDKSEGKATGKKKNKKRGR